MIFCKFLTLEIKIVLSNYPTALLKTNVILETSKWQFFLKQETPLLWRYKIFLFETNISSYGYLVLPLTPAVIVSTKHLHSSLNVQICTKYEQ